MNPKIGARQRWGQPWRWIPRCFLEPRGAQSSKAQNWKPPSTHLCLAPICGFPVFGSWSQCAAVGQWGLSVNRWSQTHPSLVLWAPALLATRREQAGEAASERGARLSQPQQAGWQTITGSWVAWLAKVAAAAGTAALRFMDRAGVRGSPRPPLACVCRATERPRTSRPERGPLTILRLSLK